MARSPIREMAAAGRPGERLVRPAGDDAPLFRGFPVNAAVIGVAFMGGPAAIGKRPVSHA